MGLLRRLASRKSEQRKENDEQALQDIDRIGSNEKGVSRANTKTERLALIQENCEVISDCLRQMEDAKIEYQAVTSYLTDMQRIDMIPAEQREDMDNAARRILNLTKEREKFREKSTSITDVQYRLFEQYELQLPKEVEAIRESERYQNDIEMDIEHLEKEKKKLMLEEEDIVSKHSFLRGLAIATGIIVVLLFGVFAILFTATGANLSLPFLMTVLMGMASTMYIYMEARKNQSDVKLVELKINRAVRLLNKIKVKSVNNRNYLEYILEKYLVSGYEQLKANWEEYIKLKDQMRRYQSNTELLEFYNKELLHELTQFRIKDTEIWLHQPNAIIDKKEMVEVRHRLNVRRQKLRERMDIYNQQKEAAVDEITTIIRDYPDCEREAVQILKTYHLR